MSVIRRLMDWIHPPPPPPATDLADAGARHGAVEDETIRRLRSELHLRRADKELARAREQLEQQRVRIELLGVRAAVRGRNSDEPRDRAAG